MLCGIYVTSTENDAQHCRICERQCKTIAGVKSHLLSTFEDRSSMLEIQLQLSFTYELKILVYLNKLHQLL